jgi:hypothetical protein
MSATLKRRIVREHVSFRRGGDEQLRDGKASKAFGPNTSADDLRYRVIGGANMDWTEERVQSLDFVVRHDGKRYLIPAVDPKTGENAPWIIVDPGVWDLYMGNWERMHSRDARVMTDEMTNTQGRGLSKWVIGEDAPFGLLEFSREEIRLETSVIDKEAIASGRILEV